MKRMWDKKELGVEFKYIELSLKDFYDESRGQYFIKLESLEDCFITLDITPAPGHETESVSIYIFNEDGKGGLTQWINSGGIPDGPIVSNTLYGDSYITWDSIADIKTTIGILINNHMAFATYPYEY